MHSIPAVCVALMLSVSAGAAQDISGAARDQTNALRAEAGQAPLAVSGVLTRAAEGHARDMAQNGFFSHTGSDGSGVGDRARAAGYRFCFIAENIASGQSSMDGALSAWMGSADHRRNILSEGAREFALARAGDIWVMVLGRPGC